jgi:hypothetical protein
VTVCHHTGSKRHPWHLITISSRGVPAHLRHGDQMPPCPTILPSFHHGHSPDADSHGQSSSSSHHEDNDGDHGNGKDNGHHDKS